MKVCILGNLLPGGRRKKRVCDGVCGVIYNAGGYADVVCWANVSEGGKRDPDYLRIVLTILCRILRSKMKLFQYQSVMKLQRMLFGED